MIPFLLLVACWNDEPGLHLEVRAGSTGAARIELYLATRPCTACMDRLKPMGVRNKLPGDAWLLDGDTVVPTPNTVYDVNRGKVVFDLIPPDAKDVEIAHLVAVGYDGAGTVVGVARLEGVTIPSGRAEFWKITLDDAADLKSSPALQPEGNRVWVWRRTAPLTSTLAACVGIEHSDGKKVERLWLVPEDDTDCDGLEQECDRFDYNAMGTTDLGNASCTTMAVKPPGITAPTCLLGGQACTDGIGDTACGPVVPYYCVPDGLCSDPTCANGTTLPLCINANRSSYLKIVFPTETSLEQCQNAGSLLRKVLVDLHTLFREPAQSAVTSCSSISFVALDIQNLDPKPDLQAGSAQFHVEALTAPCAFSLVWDQGALPMTDLYVALDVELANGLHLALPVHLEALPNMCAFMYPTATVKLNPGDGITNCARLAKSPP